MNTSAIYKINPFLSFPERILPPFNPGYDFWQRTAVPYDFALVEKGFPTGNNYFNGTSDQIIGRDLLLYAGLMSGPSTSIYDESAWGYCIQHSKSLRSTPGLLRLSSDVEIWDDRKKGLFSEALSTGLTGYALWNHDEIVHIADAGPFIGRAIKDQYAGAPVAGLRSRGIYGKNGGYKPDFFCLTKQGECVIVEAKGGIGPPSCLSPAITKGKQQVKNVDPVGIPERQLKSRLVFATNFRYEHDNPRVGKDTTLTAVDPDRDEEPISVKLSADELVEESYRSVFRFCSRGDLLYAFNSSRDAIFSEDTIGHFSVRVQGLSIFPLFASEWILIGLFEQAAKTLLATPRDNIAERMNESLQILWQNGERIGPVSEHIVIPNGVIMYRNIIDNNPPNQPSKDRRKLVY